MNERVVPRPCIFDQIFPFDDLYGASEFPAQFDPAPSAIRGRAPCACVDIKISNNAGNYIAIKNTVARDSNSIVVKFFDVPTYKVDPIGWTGIGVT